MGKTPKVSPLSNRGARTVLAVFIMKLLQTVDRDTHKPVILAEEATPLIREHCAVRLNAVVDSAPSGILALQLHRLFVERKWAHECWHPQKMRPNLRISRSDTQKNIWTMRMCIAQMI